MAFDAFTQPRDTFRTDGFTVGQRYAFLLDIPQGAVDYTNEGPNLRLPLLSTVQILNEVADPQQRLPRAYANICRWADRMPYSSILRLRAMNLAMQMLDEGMGDVNESAMVRHHLALQNITPQQLAYERQTFVGQADFRFDVMGSIAKYVFQMLRQDRLGLAMDTMDVAVALGMTVAEQRPLRAHIAAFGDSEGRLLAALDDRDDAVQRDEQRFWRRTRHAARDARGGLRRTISRSIGGDNGGGPNCA